MKKLVFSLLIALIIFFLPKYLIAQEPTIEVELISRPSSPLSKNWQFVIDTSDSTRKIFPKLRRALLEVINQPFDEFNFSIITFNNQSMEATKAWCEASKEEFNAADQFVLTHYGALSYAFKALEMAIKQNKSELTIILITDGGFTEVCRNQGNFALADECINKAQEWRRENNLADAQITCVGLENKNYTAGHKPSDEKCQEYLKGLGERSGGGYILVKNK